MSATATAAAVRKETTGAAAAPPAPDAPGHAGQEPKVTYNFPVSDIPPNPLGEGRYIKTAAALIIGCVVRCTTLGTTGLTRRDSDEILNGKTLDRNSNYFARYCFEQGVEL